MRIARWSQDGALPRLGVVEDEDVVDVLAAAPDLPHAPEAWLPAAPAAWDMLRSLAAGAPRKPLSQVTLHAPVARPGKLLAIGANYQSHLNEVAHLGLKAAPHQIWFNKQVSCLNGPHTDVALPVMSEQTDYEGELAVVIGRRCRRATPETALGFVGGYCVANDVSVRDVQLRTMTMTLGKSFDTHGPLGPWLTTADEVADPQALIISTFVNGEPRQHESTAGMLHTVRAQIVELSSILTLEPGDVLVTGTPSGVAIGGQPPRYLRPGDVVRVEIEGLGALENRFVEA